MAADLKARYSELTAEGTLQVQSGDFRQAAEQFEEALRIARELDDQHLIHRATCNLSTARLSLGQIQEAEKGLREIRSEEHTSELQSLRHLVCRLLLEKKK